MTDDSSTPPVTLSSAATSKLHGVLDSVSKSGYPGTVIGVVNSAGDELFLEGSMGADVDSVFWIASCTKFVAAIAALQLVEAGSLTLDGSLAKIVPELSHRAKFKNADPTNFDTVPAKNDITVRQLLTHTAGFRYPMFDAKTAAWCAAVHPGEEQLAPLDMPLSAEPGESFAYGMGLEWLGQAIEQATGVSFGAYVKEHILAPLGVTDATFALETRPDLMERLAGLQVHTGDGFAKFPFSEAFTRPEYESGGSGLFATPRAFLAVLGAVLAGGVSPRTGRRILKQETVDDMFVPQTLDVPDQGALATGELAAAMPTHTRRIPLLPGRKAWTLSHLTNLEQMPNGKSAGAGEWYGLANLYWTIDRRAGVAALAFSQTLPFGLPEFFDAKDRMQEIIFAPGALVDKAAA